ncbi:ribonucleoside-diphosphate reductase [Litchfieldella qijiaojingensis]|uniref:Ribonucleoside-diphosphate reductase n=1 Tax=Litchfieldella qijiaojingensis TaxID=980347 RepID=A0ABQ2YPM8_9GAMM|nr:ribonucleoside-diphosphate reductase subunit alpha [Halomonas qijiaojingensis]GGX91096.1 ribonucleoside-diphosphate reductase [Halomonas qijiaojingensis]
MNDYHGIKLHSERDKQLTEIARDLLSGFYLGKQETYQVALARPALAFSDDLEMAQDIYNDISKGWAMYSSPILSNAPEPGEKPKAMPISCFLGYVPDTREGLVEHQEELAWLSMLGGGVGGHWDHIRSVSEKSVGPLPHIKIADSAVEGFRQGKTRKGSYAAYLDVSHPDILEFLYMRTPTGGDINRKCFNIHHAVNLTDEFMEACLRDDEWSLRCPHSGHVTDNLSARDLFQWILDTRFRTGEPYLNFIDTANRHLPDVLKKLGLKINGSNLCNEIHLATNEERTAVCCLSSVNLERYDEWKRDPEFIKRWIRFLDNVLTFFIENAPSEMHKAVYSAYRERSIGLGAMGFHSYLQSKMIPWETFEAQLHNKAMFGYISRMVKEATYELAEERGEAPDMEGTGRRNAHLLAIAPNANSGLLCGTSPSIEPLRSNAFSQRTRAGTHLVKNRHLQRILESHAPSDAMLLALGLNVDDWLAEQWQSIVLENGSVQHLDYLTDHEKRVFRTAFETDPEWTVIHAADRQPMICQGQSVNLYFPFETPRHKVLMTHLLAWKRGLKGLYYLRTESGFTGDKVSKSVERNALKDHQPTDDQEECAACQG